MILPALVALLAAVGPLLRGSWDLWAQALLHLLVISGLTLWLLTRIVVGFLPLPSNRVMAWIGVLTALAAASAWASPLPGFARPAFYVFLQGLWIFAAMAALSKDERTVIDQLIRVGAWILMALAFHEHWSLGLERPASALLNQNIYAGVVLLLLPLALERGDWLLAAGLLWSLLWTKSAGAWLGLAGALAITRRRDHPAWAKLGVAVVLICAVVVYGRLDTPEVLHRWGWWKAAWAMAVDRPFSGYGPGSFAYVLPAYRSMAPYGLYSLYAHQYFLETAAGFGLLFALVWFGGLWRVVMSEGHYKRFAVIAMLLHSLWDYTLAIPGAFWLFCYCAASAIPDSSRGVNIPSAYKPVAAALALGVGLAMTGGVWSLWAADRTIALASVAFEEGRLEEAGRRLEAARRLNPLDAERPILAAAVELRGAAGGSSSQGFGPLLAAAAALEEAARLNPYRSSTWVELASVYRSMGRSTLAAQVEERAAAVRPR